MIRALLTALALVAALVTASAAPAALAADPVKGEKLHQDCLQCHGTKIYLPPRRKINSVKALRKEVERWNDSYNPKMKKSEIDDLVAYLDRDFYKFGKP